MNDGVEKEERGAPAEVWLVSACLLGTPCRYDGTAAKQTAQNALIVLGDTATVVSVCPEELGGLPTPRPAANLVGGDGAAALDGTASVKTGDGQDVTKAFLAGAKRVSEIAAQVHATHACLKARSPSCGCGSVHQATAANTDPTLASGDGVTAALLKRKGLVVVSDESLGAFRSATAGTLGGKGPSR